MSTQAKSAEALGPHTDTTKLVSLLALAAGAVAMPQTGHADIIYNNLGGIPAVVGPGGDIQFLFDVPGAAVVGFRRQEAIGYTQPGELTVNYRLVLGGDLDGNDSINNGMRANGAGIAIANPFGATWNQGVLYYNIPVGIADDLNRQNPLTGYDNKYLAWFFEDSTQGNARFYGWAEVSLSLANYNAGGPTLTIWSYAYDNTGAKPTMGQLPIPEPTSGALLVMGAMALGARGLRKWRQNRPPVTPA
jgi:hypothetical protein